MNLARKITLALALLAFTVIAGLEGNEVQRELSRSVQGMQRDHRLLGQTLGSAFVRVWEMEGKAQAVTLLAEANRSQEQVRLSWVPFDARVTERLPLEHVKELRAGRDTSWMDERQKPGVLRSYTPVTIGETKGAIEISRAPHRAAAPPAPDGDERRGGHGHHRPGLPAGGHGHGAPAGGPSRWSSSWRWRGASARETWRRGCTCARRTSWPPWPMR